MGCAPVEQLRRDPMIRFRSLQASCNARRPINKLPTEILTEIFANALDEGIDNPYLLQDLSQVCSQWRNIIAASPLLYRSFRVENPMLTARHLRRSRGLPLDVDICDVTFDVPRTVALMNSVSILGPQLDRVRSLSVTSHSSKMSAWVLGMLEDFPHRKLTSLSLALTRREGPVSLHLPDSKEAEGTLRGLTSLRLCNLNIERALCEPSDLQDGRQDGRISFSLRRLELEFTIAPPPTNATLIHLLSRCPQLEDLTLRSAHPIAFERKSEDGECLPMCRLSRLRTFTYHAPNFKTLADIIRHIEPDVSRMPKFDLSFPMADKAVAALLCRPSDNGKRTYKLACMGQSLLRIDVRFSREQLQILGSYKKEHTTSGPDVKLALASDVLVGTTLEPSLFFWSWPIKDVSNVKVLSFHLYGAFDVPADQAHWASLLRPLRSLSTLVLAGAWWIDVYQLFKALDSALPDNSLVCPNLATVELYDTIGYRKLPGPGRKSTAIDALMSFARCNTLEILVR
ncbi:hypothetical protein TRAPUB_5245 [Trametes pubescens]|uniref:F-box domain-containing protein n=1 Tax=Trametes pubescens TaxID=154538 RepID=A0A1M2V994_TRAPU|nr:hypothetical protein TRAPUB_5245 [Trametes pubescens]